MFTIIGPPSYVSLKTLSKLYGPQHENLSFGFLTNKPAQLQRLDMKVKLPLRKGA